MPGVRIIGTDMGASNCGCPKGKKACINPCGRQRTVLDDLETKLDATKTSIVTKAKRLQRMNVWIKQVHKIVQHYTKKLSEVESSAGATKKDVVKLFAKKKHLEDLIMQYQLDRAAFNQQMASTKAKKQQAAGKGEKNGWVFRENDGELSGLPKIPPSLQKVPNQ